MRWPRRYGARNVESAPRLGRADRAAGAKVSSRNGARRSVGARCNRGGWSGVGVRNRKETGTQRRRIAVRGGFRFRSHEIEWSRRAGAPDLERPIGRPGQGRARAVRSAPRNGTAGGRGRRRGRHGRVIRHRRRVVHLRCEAGTEGRRITGESDVRPAFSRDLPFRPAFASRCRCGEDARARAGGARVNLGVSKRHDRGARQPDPGRIGGGSGRATAAGRSRCEGRGNGAATNR